MRLPTRGAEGYAYAVAIGTGVSSLVLVMLIALRVFDQLPVGPWRLEPLRIWKVTPASNGAKGAR